MLRFRSVAICTLAPQPALVRGPALAQRLRDSVPNKHGLPQQRRAARDLPVPTRQPDDRLPRCDFAGDLEDHQAIRLAHERMGCFSNYRPPAPINTPTVLGALLPRQLEVLLGIRESLRVASVLGLQEAASGRLTTTSPRMRKIARPTPIALKVKLTKSPHSKDNAQQRHPRHEWCEAASSLPTLILHAMPPNTGTHSTKGTHSSGRDKAGVREALWQGLISFDN